MLTDEMIVELRDVIALNFNRDIAQDVTVSLLKNRHNKAIKNFRDYSFWLAHRIRIKESKYNKQNTVIWFAFEVEWWLNKCQGGAVTYDIDGQIDARMKLKELVKDPHAKRVIDHETGTKPLKKNILWNERHSMKEMRQ